MIENLVLYFFLRCKLDLNTLIVDVDNFSLFLISLQLSFIQLFMLKKLLQSANHQVWIKMNCSVVELDVGVIMGGCVGRKVDSIISKISETNCCSDHLIIRLSCGCGGKIDKIINHGQFIIIFLIEFFFYQAVFSSQCCGCIICIILKKYFNLLESRGVKNKPAVW